MPKQITIPRSLFLLLVAAPPLLGAQAMTGKQRDFDVIRDGD